MKKDKYKDKGEDRATGHRASHQPPIGPRATEPPIGPPSHRSGPGPPIGPRATEPATSHRSGPGPPRHRSGHGPPIGPRAADRATGHRSGHGPPSQPPATDPATQPPIGVKFVGKSSRIGAALHHCNRLEPQIGGATVGEKLNI